MQCFWAQAQTIRHLTSGNLLALYNAFIRELIVFWLFTMNLLFSIMLCNKKNVLLVRLQTLIYDKALTLTSTLKHNIQLYISKYF